MRSIVSRLWNTGVIRRLWNTGIIRWLWNTGNLLVIGDFFRWLWNTGVLHGLCNTGRVSLDPWPLAHAMQLPSNVCHGIDVVQCTATSSAHPNKTSQPSADSAGEIISATIAAMRGS